jgi:hypothetical protein
MPELIFYSHQSRSLYYKVIIYGNAYRRLHAVSYMIMLHDARLTLTGGLNLAPKGLEFGTGVLVMQIQAPGGLNLAPPGTVARPHYKKVCNFAA